MSPRLAFRKATDLLPVTGPVSSQEERRPSGRLSFYLANLVNPANPVKLFRSCLKTHVAIFDAH
jgi:hypothetical protein